MPEREKKQRSKPGYSRSEFSKLTGLSARRIDRMIDLGELKIITLGGVSAIPPSELRRIRALFDMDDAESAA